LNIKRFLHLAKQDPPASAGSVEPPRARPQLLKDGRTAARRVIRWLALSPKRVLGLDIGSSSVKAIALRKDNPPQTGLSAVRLADLTAAPVTDSSNVRRAEYVVTAAAIADIAPYQPGETNKKKANTLRAVRRCLEAAGAGTRLVVCSLSGPEVVVRDFEFSSIPPEEIAGVVALEASQICPFNTDDCAIDYQIIPSPAASGHGDSNDKIEGVLVAAAGSLIKSRLRITREASLDCAMLDIDGLALLNCSNAFPPPDFPGSVPNGRAILNIGNAHATLAVMRPNGRPFIRDMTYAGGAIINQIASENSLPIETVTELLAGQTSDFQQQIADSLEKATRRLADEIITTSRYCKTQDKDADFDGMLVCGGFALLEGFIQMLQSQLPLQVVPWNPFENVRCDAGSKKRTAATQELLRTKGPALAVAAGLALRSV